MLRIAPPELLDDLEADRLRALGVIRAEVDVDEAPPVAIRDLRTEAVDVVVGAGDRENRRVEDGGSEHLPRFEGVGDEDAALEAEARGVRGHAVRKVAGRRARKDVEPELHGARRRHRDDAVLVGERRMIHGIVFDVELADTEARREPIAAHERGEAGVEAGARLSRNGQQLAIAPEIFRPALDLVARERDRGVVVDRLERPEALRAHVARFRRKRRLAQMTLQSDQRVHTASATGIWNEECGMWNAESRTGAGTTAALSRAIAAMSLRIATAVASPPAPTPKMPVSPECSPATIAAF